MKLLRKPQHHQKKGETGVFIEIESIIRACALR